MSRSLTRRSDGIVTLRASTPADVRALIAGRDEQFYRFMGEGSDEPQPTAIIEVDGEIVGWVDYDSDRSWLRSGTVNVGYNLFSEHRSSVYATRSVELLIQHLQDDTDVDAASLLIDPDNAPSLAVARRAGSEPTSDVDGQRQFIRSTQRPEPGAAHPAPTDRHPELADALGSQREQAPNAI